MSKAEGLSFYREKVAHLQDVVAMLDDRRRELGDLELDQRLREAIAPVLARDIDILRELEGRTVPCHTTWCLPCANGSPDLCEVPR